MKTPRRKHGSRRLDFELLEDRLTPAQAPWQSLFVSAPADIIVDDARHLIYVPTRLGKIERYDWVNNQRLTPIIVGGDLFGGDISPDGTTLLVADRILQNNQDVIHRINLNDLSVTDVAFARQSSGASVNFGTFDVSILSNQEAWITLAGGGTFPLMSMDLDNNVVSVFHDSLNPSITLSNGAELERSANRESIAIRSPDRSGGLNTIWLATDSSHHLARYDLPGGDGIASAKFPSWSPDGQLFSMQVGSEYISINHADGSPDTFKPGRAAIYTPDGQYLLKFRNDYLYPAYVAENRVTGKDDWSLPLPSSTQQGELFGSLGRFSSDGAYLFTLGSFGLTISKLPDADEFDVATQFEVTASQPVMSVGLSQQITVTAKDIFGRRVSNYAGTIQLGNQAFPIFPINYTFQPGDHGSHTFDLGYDPIVPQFGTIMAIQQDNRSIQGSVSVARSTGELSGYQFPVPYVSNSLKVPELNQFFAISGNGITQFDMRDGRVLGHWKVGVHPRAMALSQDGQTLYVTEGVTFLSVMSVYRLNLQTGSVLRIDSSKDAVDDSFSDIVATSDGKFLLEPTGNSITSDPLFQLRTLDPATNTINWFGGQYGTGLFRRQSKPFSTADGQHAVFVNNLNQLRWFDTATGLSPSTVELAGLDIQGTGATISRDGQYAGLLLKTYFPTSVVVDRQGNVVQQFLNRFVQFDETRDWLYSYTPFNGSGSFPNSSFVTVYDTQTWNKLFEYNIPQKAQWPVGGFTRFLLDPLPVAIPIPPLDSVWIAPGSTSVVEGDAGVVFMEFPVRLSQVSTTPVSVNYSTEDDNAHVGIDYLPISGTLTFTPGQTLQIVKVPVLGNILPQGSRAFYLKLSNAQHGYIITDFAQGVIEDHDQPVYARFQVSEGSGSESQTNVTVQVVLDHAVPVPVSVTYHLMSPGDSPDFPAAAELGKDVTGLTGRVSFQPGQTVGQLQFRIINDSIDELDEQFAVVLDGAQGGIFLPDQRAFVYTILDDDAPPELSLVSNRIITREGNGQARIQARLSQPSEKPVSASILATGSAVLNDDFSCTDFIFAPGQTTASAIIDINDDTTYERGEAANLRLANPLNATLKLMPQIQLAISDNDPPPRFMFNAYSIEELMVVRNAEPFYISVPMDRNTQVSFQVQAVALAGSTAIEGRDYRWIKRSLHLGDSEFLAIQFLPQAPGTPVRILKLGLRALSGAQVGSPSTLTFRLVDDAVA